MARTNPGNFISAVEKFLDSVQQDVTENIEKGLDESQKFLLQALVAASPHKTHDYENHWKPIQGGKGYRRVINDKTVPWKGKQQSLAGILEYSTKHAKPHIEATRRKVRPDILRILKESITDGATAPKGDN